jgi:ABC-type sugar transport system permease subunit
MFSARNADFGSDEKISFIQALAETGFQTILDAVVITIFSLLIAVMLNGNFKGRAFARAVFFLPVILNSEAIKVAINSTSAIDSVLNSIGQNALSQIFDMKSFFAQIGVPVKIVEFLSGITSTIYSTISYAGVQILIFLAAIQSVPGHLYEAAKIEGATKYESFWKITLPMVSPMILTVVVYTIVDSFLRSDLSFYIGNLRDNYKYGLHAAVSWCYILLSLLILGIALLFLKKVVFYHDERN